METAYFLVTIFTCNIFFLVCNVESRAIFIEVTHEDNFHVHDFQEQQDVIPLTKFEMELWDINQKNGENEKNESDTDKIHDQLTSKISTSKEKEIESTTTSSILNVTLNSESTTTSNNNNISNQSIGHLNDTPHNENNETIDEQLNEHKTKQTNGTGSTGQHRTVTTKNPPGDKPETGKGRNKLKHDVQSVWAALQNRKRQAVTNRNQGGGHMKQGGGGTERMSRVKLGRLKRRHKRQTNIDMQNIANQDWAFTTKSPLGNLTRDKTDKTKDNFQVITDEDRKNAQKAEYKAILVYIGSTLLTVLTFTAITFCFLKDPKTCIVAFGTGCPCCLVVFPCITRFVDKYLNPAKIVKENLNKYLPGVIIHDDGTIEKYNATPEEMECISEIINEVMDQ